LNLPSRRNTEGQEEARDSYRGIVLKLSLSDILHEWILNLCLVMAVAAVFSPLLILFGVKNGTVQTLRSRLMQDPRNCEIRPLTSRSFSADWFREMRLRPDIAFIVPTTRQISSTVDVYLKTETGEVVTRAISMDVVPTDAGDKLILENGASVPGEGECVLTSSAAENLGIIPGNTVLLRVKRLKEKRFETADLHLTVVGILAERASGLKVIYAGLEVLEAIERFKDGIAVPERGWPGSVPKAYPQYDGLAVMLPKQLTKIEEVELFHNTGFSEVEHLSNEELAERLGSPVHASGVFYFLSAGQRPVGQESVNAVKHRLRGKGASMAPFVKPIPADLIDHLGRKVSQLELRTLSFQGQVPKASEIFKLPTWDDEKEGTAEWRKIVLSRDEQGVEGVVQLQVSHDDDLVTFPVAIMPEKHTGKDCLISPRLAGVLNLRKHRKIIYRPELDEFVISPREYAGFRMYAASIDDVEGLKRHLEAMGIPVNTEADRIVHVRDLDNYLSLIFWLIATVGIAGGSASLVASLYASVERKKKHLGVLRLLGVSKSALFLFPVYQGLFVTICGFAVGYLFYRVLEGIINRSFSAHLQGQESLCNLSLLHIGTMLSGMLTIAVVAGVVAAWRTTRIEPAEALRDE
jgi:putative ABC transport system permease protein